MREDIISESDARILEAAKNICEKYSDLFDDVSRDSERMPEIRGYADTAIKFDYARDFLQSALISAEIRSDQKAVKGMG